MADDDLELDPRQFDELVQHILSWVIDKYGVDRTFTIPLDEMETIYHRKPPKAEAGLKKARFVPPGETPMEAFFFRRYTDDQGVEQLEMRLDTVIEQHFDPRNN